MVNSRLSLLPWGGGAPLPLALPGVLMTKAKALRVAIIFATTSSVVAQPSAAMLRTLAVSGV